MTDKTRDTSHWVVENSGDDLDWYVIDKSEPPTDENYYGVVAMTFLTREEAQQWIDDYNTPAGITERAIMRAQEEIVRQRTAFF